MDLGNNEIETLQVQAEAAVNDGDIRKLIYIFERMSDAGISEAIARIGELYELGFKSRTDEFERDLDQAANWYRKAIAEHDDPLAHLGLGRIYFQGSKTVVQDAHLAHVHLSKAYAHGLHQAGIYLGILSMSGHDSRKAILEAEQFFCSAGAAGFPVAYRYLADISFSSGHICQAIQFLLKWLLRYTLLKLKDRNHPNLWKIPR